MAMLNNQRVYIYIYILWKYGLPWYQNDPLGGNSNILHGFLPPKHHLPNHCRLWSNAWRRNPRFSRLQLDRVGVRYWARWVRWIFGKKTGNFTGENGGNWESRLINYGIPGLFTPQRYIFLGLQMSNAFRLGDVLIMLTFYPKAPRYLQRRYRVLPMHVSRWFCKIWPLMIPGPNVGYLAMRGRRGRPPGSQRNLRSYSLCEWICLLAAAIGTSMIGIISKVTLCPNVWFFQFYPNHPNRAIKKYRGWLVIRVLILYLIYYKVDDDP